MLQQQLLMVLESVSVFGTQASGCPLLPDPTGSGAWFSTVHSEGEKGGETHTARRRGEKREQGNLQRKLASLSKNRRRTVP